MPGLRPFRVVLGNTSAHRDPESPSPGTRKQATSMSPGVDVPKLVRAYINYARATDDSEEQAENFWAFDALNRLALTEPVAAWEAITQLVAADSSDRVIEIVAAGPVE